MSWKDYFSLDRRDRQAVILLLLLIVFAGIFYALNRKSTTIAPEQAIVYRQQFDSLQKSNSKTTPSLYPLKLRQGETVDINTADTTLLKRIPGIGSAYSKRIVNYRKSLGGYVSINQISEVWGIDTALFVKIEPYLAISEGHQKIEINKLTLDELRKHPYISYKQAKAIVAIRKKEGIIKSVDQLAGNKEFTEKDIERLTPYLSFG